MSEALRLFSGPFHAYPVFALIGWNLTYKKQLQTIGMVSFFSLVAVVWCLIRAEGVIEGTPILFGEIKSPPRRKLTRRWQEIALKVLGSRGKRTLRIRDGPFCVCQLWFQILGLLLFLYGNPFGLISRPSVFTLFYNHEKPSSETLKCSYKILPGGVTPPLAFHPRLALQPWTSLRVSSLVWPRCFWSVPLAVWHLWMWAKWKRMTVKCLGSWGHTPAQCHSDSGVAPLTFSAHFSTFPHLLLCVCVCHSFAHLLRLPVLLHSSLPARLSFCSHEH